MAANFSMQGPEWWNLPYSRKIDVQRQAHGLSSWGLVIYRCTYGDNAAWTRFLEIYKQRIRRGLNAENHIEVEDTLATTVLEDRDSFEGASADDVRDHFRSWCQRALPDRSIQSPHQVPPTPRYQYCVLVDAEALESVLTGPEPPRPDLKGKEWVNVVDARWRVTGQIREDLKGVEDYSDDYDIGYMRVALAILIPYVYGMWCEEPGWTTNYRRPPFVLYR